MIEVVFTQMELALTESKLIRTPLVRAVVILLHCPPGLCGWSIQRYVGNLKIAQINRVSLCKWRRNFDKVARHGEVRTRARAIAPLSHLPCYSNNMIIKLTWSDLISYPALTTQD